MDSCERRLGPGSGSASGAKRRGRCRARSIAAVALLCGGLISAEIAGAQTSIVATELEIEDLGIPAINDAGTVVFTGEAAGGEGVFTSQGAGYAKFADLADGFDSIEVAAIADDGAIVFQGMMTNSIAPARGLFFSATPPDEEEFFSDYPWRGYSGLVAIANEHVMTTEPATLTSLRDPTRSILLEGGGKVVDGLLDVNNSGYGVFPRVDLNQGFARTLVVARIIDVGEGFQADIRDVAPLPAGGAEPAISLSDTGIIAVAIEDGLFTATVDGSGLAPVVIPGVFSIREVSINDGGAIAALCRITDVLGEYGDPGDEVTAIVRIEGGAATKIIAEGDVIAGQFVLESFDSLSHRGFNSAGQVAFLGDIRPIGGADDIEAILMTAGGNAPLPRPTPTPQADGFHWINPAGGNFAATANWDPEGVPGSGDTAFFDLPAAYTVNVGTHTVERLIVGGEPSIRVTFDNPNLTATAASLDDPSVLVDHGTFVVDGGSLGSRHSVIGASAVSSAVLRNTSWVNDGRFTIGRGGEATFSVSDSVVNSAETRIGNAGNGAPGTATISGTASLWIPGNLAVGLTSPGTLRIESGASVLPERVALGGSVTANGTIEVDGSAQGMRSTLSATQIIVGGRSLDDFDNGGPGTLSVINGGLAQVQGGGVVIGFTGEGNAVVSGRSGGASSELLAPSMAIGGSASGNLAVSSGGRVATIADGARPGCMDVGIEARGELTVDGVFDGEPSRVDVDDLLIVGNAAEGSLTVTNGGRVAARIIRLGAESGATGTLVVQGESPAGAASQVDARFRLDMGGVAFGDQEGGSGAAQVLNGALVLAGGTFVGGGGTGSLSIDGTGTVSNESSTVDTGIAAVGLGTRAGNVTISNGGRFEVSQTLGIYGASMLDTVTGAVTVGLIDPLLGTVRIGANGVLGGDGTIRGIVQNLGGSDEFVGTAAPGASPGTLTIEGEYLQGPHGVLELEVDGPALHDVLNVTGDVEIGGSIRLTFIGGFAPQQGQQFEVLKVGGEVDLSAATFETRNLAPGFEFDVVPGAGGVVVTALNDAVFLPPGDPNCDGFLSVADLAALSAVIASGERAPCLDDDVNRDGVVDGLDIELTIRALYRRSGFANAAG